MKTFFSVAAMAAYLLFSFNADAQKIRRVGFFANQISNQDYTSLQAAINASNAGDILLIYPSGNTWQGTIDRKLTLIGNGYFLAGAGANTNVQALTGNITIQITLAAGSDSSVLEGLNNLTLTVDSSNKTTIKRCNGYIYFTTGLLKDFKILQSYVKRIERAGFDAPTVQNLNIENCYIGSLDFKNFKPSTAIFKNVIIDATITGLYFELNQCNCSFINSIFLSTQTSRPSGFDNSSFSHCISANGIIPKETANKLNIDMSTVFVGYPTQSTFSTDGRFQLTAGSSAIGAGENGIDCGIFGGSNAYKLSGIPPIPSFYKLTSPSTTADTNPYTITFSVRGNN